MKFKMNPILCLILPFLMLENCNTQEKTYRFNQCVELGKVSWYRDYNVAIELSKKKQKAILIFFQEVPGCSTCKNYGQNVLSHPLMVEAIENLFIPVVIYNNKEGKDKLILNKYNEPSWNNPVIRFVNSNGANLIKRISGDYTSVGLYNAMQRVLDNTGTAIPEYFKLLGQELKYYHNENFDIAYFKMYCFWNGEKQLGKVEGVLETESGFINQNEAVKVKYNSQLVDLNQLSDFAQKNNFVMLKNNKSFNSSAGNIHYYLQNSVYIYLPLTELQKTKINSALGNNFPAEKYLSPKQLMWLKELKSTERKGKLLANKNFNEAWELKSKGK